MNISTYEARIAALEAQLGPGPGPVTGGGILSVVLTPDITLAGNVSLNDGLTGVMPIEYGESKTKEGICDIEPNTPFNIELTPDSNGYPFYEDPSSGDYVVGDKGQSMKFQINSTAALGTDAFLAYMGVSNMVDPESEDANNATLQIYLKKAN